ncbi:PAS domain-containing hybrid sensor histidine kinase/response regulator [Opitutus terrae]|uniref:histidine kinase n=1 Tax=Opitutus terrae (strain DSM 11246 / JCM 15787 / PB90-1) TaxID=452637 RepID=B1ZW85_OPITP|nr:PAS domain-containing sensor histidine kinase [Opitutus terrae]ACB76837.1 multi-sensor hybrid histidine kinase [Opitutus terrae PB90-1]
MRIYPHGFALRTTLVYAAAAALWITFSDWAVLLLVQDVPAAARLSIYKGWAFVAVTSLLLYGVLQQWMARLKRQLDEQAKIEVELRQWADAFNHCAHGIAIGIPATNRLLACNPAFAAMHGFTVAEMNGRDVLTLYVPSDWEHVRRNVAIADRDGRVQFQANRVRKDGSVFTVQVDLVSVRDANEALLYRVTTVQDVTERNRAEAQRRESEDRFRAVVENIHEVFWIHDPSHIRIVYVSPAFEKIWGRPCAEVVNWDSETWLQTLHADDRERLRRVVQGGTPEGYDEQYRILRPDGTERWVHDRSFPVKDGAGRVVRIVGVAQDITERKQLESQFLRAQRLEAIGTLAGGVAHDLNNILAPMLMAAGLLKENITNEHDREMLSMVERSARRGADIIRQLLTFSRGVEGSRLALQIRHLVREMMGIMRETFPREITLIDQTKGELWPVVADATQLHQVLVNLCVNARDAMPHGGTLAISAVNVEFVAGDAQLPHDAPPGSYVMLSVKDTGVGMTPEIMERIFDPFFTTKDLGRGTGLGLSTVLGIVRSHGGFVNVSSEAGKGSDFRVYLPASRAEVAEPAAEPAEPLPLGHGELILVVDDEEPIRDATRHVLVKQNYRVVTATDGKEAVTAFLDQRDNVQLLLTDMMMPQMGGAALIRALRLLNPQLKVIATSGLDSHAGDGELAELGLSDILPKPCGPKALIESIQRALMRN